jgi:flagellar biosynthetic protein FliR
LNLTVPFIEAFGLYILRTSTLILAAPLLGSGTGFSSYKIALIVGISVAAFMSTGEPLVEEAGAIEFAMMCLHEVMIGMFLAFVLQMVLLSVRVAGEIIGTEMSFNMASLVDPNTGIQTPLITQIYEVMFFLSLLSINGHHWLLRALGSSFERAPIGGIGMKEGLLPMILTLFTRMFSAGIVLGGPILVLLMMVSVLIGFLSRVVPQINVMEVGFNIRISVGLVALLIFSPYIAPGMNMLFEHLMTGLGDCLDALEA